jgi:hypothetical protein
MARTGTPIVTRNAVYVKERKDGKDVFVQRPYDLVELNWGDANPNPTYIQPHGYTLSKSLRSRVYDDVRYYDAPPVWDLSGGGSGL